MKHGKLVGYFIADQQSSFYKSNNFTSVLQYIQSNPTACKMKEKQTRSGLRLLLTFDKISTIEKALESLQKIQTN